MERFPSPYPAGTRVRSKSGELATVRESCLLHKGEVFVEFDEVPAFATIPGETCRHYFMQASEVAEVVVPEQEPTPAPVHHTKVFMECKGDPSVGIWPFGCVVEFDQDVLEGKDQDERDEFRTHLEILGGNYVLGETPCVRFDDECPDCYRVWCKGECVRAEEDAIDEAMDRAAHLNA